MRDRRQQISDCGIIAKCLADVPVKINVARREHKAAAKLEGILAEPMLVMSCFAGALASSSVIAPQEMQERCSLEVDCLIGLSVLVHQQWKSNAGFVAKRLRVGKVSQSDGGQPRSLIDKRWLVITQLRDVLAAEDSPVMTKEDEHRRAAFP